MADLITGNAVTFINSSREQETKTFKNGEIPADYVMTKRYVQNDAGEMFYKIFITDRSTG